MKEAQNEYGYNIYDINALLMILRQKYNKNMDLIFH